MKVTQRRTSSNTFVKSLQIRVITLPPIYIHKILIFIFKSLSNQIGTTPIRTIQGKDTNTDRLPCYWELVALLPQNINPKLFNKLPKEI